MGVFTSIGKKSVEGIERKEDIKDSDGEFSFYIEFDPYIVVSDDRNPDHIGQMGYSKKSVWEYSQE